MKDKLSVIIGSGIGNQKEIANKISKNFDVKTVKTMWPRDSFVYFGGKYIKRDSPENIDGYNPFGEGGHILTGKDYLLISDMVYNHDQIPKDSQNKPEYKKVKKAIIDEGKKYYPNARIHVAPSGYFNRGKGHNHIDMFCLLIQGRGLLLVDTYYGKCAGTSKEYDKIAEKEKLKLIKYDGSKDKVWNPLNALVLPENKNSSPKVVVDNKAKSLIKLLKNEEVETIGVEMPQNSFPGGKIRCQTNTYNPKDKLIFKEIE
jgi:hypothetical protein